MLASWTPWKTPRSLITLVAMMYMPNAENHKLLLLLRSHNYKSQI